MSMENPQPPTESVAGEREEFESWRDEFAQLAEQLSQVDANDSEAREKIAAELRACLDKMPKDDFSKEVNSYF